MFFKLVTRIKHFMNLRAIKTLLSLSNIYQCMLFSSIKERIEYLSKNLVNMPRAGIEPTSPCILVRSANHYTIRDHHAGNVAV